MKSLGAFWEFSQGSLLERLGEGVKETPHVFGFKRFVLGPPPFLEHVGAVGAHPGVDARMTEIIGGFIDGLCRRGDLARCLCDDSKWQRCNYPEPSVLQECLRLRSWRSEIYPATILPCSHF